MHFSAGLLSSILVIMISLQRSVVSIPIDNGVKGYPHVTCGPHSVQVDVNTLKPFNGRVYVKGEAHRKECVRAFRGTGGNLGYGISSHSVERHYGGGEQGQTVGIELKFGQCNMKRQRTLYPRGVEYTFTMVVSFHPLFLTKVDRAYRVRCFYMEAEKTVFTNLDVSMLTTQQVNEQFPMPQCQYKLKRGGYDGPYVRYAKVGDKIVHVWHCDKTGYVYGILVKNCYVDDGQGNKVELINNKGCAIDAHLVPDLTYDDHLISAYVETHVFKYADKAHLQFTCTIQLCFKNDGGCQGITPPKCGYGSLNAVVPQTPLLPPHAHVESGPPPPPETYPPHPHIPISPSEVPSYAAPGPQPPLPIPLYPAAPPIGASNVPYTDGHLGILPPPAPSYPLQPQHPLGPQHLNPAVLSPYKDQPINTNQSTKVKRSIDQGSPEPNLIEADFSTQTVIVLPFDESVDSSERDLVELSSVEPSRDQKILPKAAVSLDGICMTSSGFGILVSLLVTMFLFSATLITLVARKQWAGQQRQKA